MAWMLPTRVISNSRLLDLTFPGYSASVVLPASRKTTLSDIDRIFTTSVRVGVSAIRYLGNPIGCLPLSCASDRVPVSNLETFGSRRSLQVARSPTKSG